MEVIPAVDILDGRVVRLIGGVRERAIQYSSDPMKVVEKWISQGAKTIHLVDLNAALSMGDNKELIFKIISSFKVRFQVGGGIRSKSYGEELLRRGAYRVIVGTMAYERVSEAKQLLNSYGSDRVVVAVDYGGNGRVLLRGWLKKSSLMVEEAVKQFKREGFKTFLLTSASRDGTLSGLDFEFISKCSRHANIIAAGGVSGLSDLIELKRIGVKGVVVGRALYEGVFTLREAIRRVGNDFG